MKKAITLMISSVKRKCLIVILSMAFSVPGVTAQVTADFSNMVNGPLLKKFSMYSTTLIENSNMNDYYVRNDRDFNKILPLDAPSYRIDLAMGKGNCWGGNIVNGTASNRTYNWTELDNWTKRCNANNVMPYVSWSYMATPFQGATFRNVNSSIPNWLGLWGDMHADLAAHMKSVCKTPFYNEIYNEPDLGEFFWNVLNIHDENVAFLQRDDFRNYYNDMYKNASLGIRRGNPDAIVGGPGFALGDYYGGGFMDYVKANNLPLDFFSFHTYRNNSPWPNNVNSVRSSLQSKGFSQTALHVSEYNFNGTEPDWNQASFWGNHFQGARTTLNHIKEFMDVHQDIEKIHWAMFLNASVNGMGMVDFNGTKKAIYNAFEIFADMPVSRYNLNITDPDLTGMASKNDTKCAIVIWNNNTSAAKNITINFSNVNFPTGDVKVYRIDQNNASAYDGAPQDLSAVTTLNGIGANGYQWSGSIPAEGVVYITMNKAGLNQVDFHPENTFLHLANFIKPHFFYYDRGKSFWNHFDEKRWTAYVGSGNEAGGMVAPVGVEADNLPPTLNFKGELTGSPASQGVNTLVGIQIDFRTGSNYTKSVLFHGGVYNTGRNWGLPWGQGSGAASVVKQVNLADFTITLADYAPAGWDGRVIITSLVQDCGANVKFTVHMNSAQIVNTTPVPLLSGHTYTIKSKSSSKVCGVVNNGINNTDKVVQQTYADNTSQKWVAFDLGGGYWKFINVRSVKSLEIELSSTVDGGAAEQYTFSNTNWQRWKVEPASAGYFKMTNFGSGKVLDVSGGPSAIQDGVKIQQWTSLNADNQQWSFDEVVPVSEGKTYVITAKHSGKAVQVYNSGKNSGDKIGQFALNNLTAQNWIARQLAGVMAHFDNVNSGKSLEVGGLSVKLGAALQQWDYVANNWQQWSMVGTDEGYYQFINKGSNMVMDVNGGVGSLADGDSIHQWNYVGADNQKWKITEVSGLITELKETYLDNVTLYPNPAKESITISGIGVMNYVAITDIQGRVLYKSNELFSGSKTIHLNEFAEGMYFILIKGDKSQSLRKFAVKSNN
jgi:xylan 1,4-beta-xylosidase